MAVSNTSCVIVPCISSVQLQGVLQGLSLFYCGYGLGFIIQTSFSQKSADAESTVLDLVVLRYSTAVNHYTALNLTKLDVLDTFSTIQVAVAYIGPDGEKLTTFPADLNILNSCKVQYETLQGWESTTKGARTWSELPPQAQKYVEFIESSVGVKIVYIGTGPDREDMIFRE